ncbi:MAG: DUF2789 domain-containing protein [Burkholderiaceae bacterium]
MEKTYHRFTELFQQLGLSADIDSIKQFVADHSPLDPAIRLENAPFWNESQADFLRDEVQQDADWAEVIDQLNVALRRKATP